MEGLTGLEAIYAHNGFAISVIGITIVFAGLTFLAMFLSQLYKVLALWDDRKNIMKGMRTRKSKQPAEEPLVYDHHLPYTMRESARNLKMLTEFMGEPFSLPRLLELAETRGLTRPHSTVLDLYNKKHIVSDGKGRYIWNLKFTR